MIVNPADIKERELALQLDQSFCVQAPAGSGKTELLTQRYLSLLAKCDRPEEILAITFTRKSAAEMRNRLLENMNKAEEISEADLTAMPEHQRFTQQLAQQVITRNNQHQWGLIENTSRLRISTIDSFNSFLTNQMPVVSEMGVMPQVQDDASILYEEAVLDLLTELEKDSDLSRHISVILSHTNNQWSLLAGLLINLLAKRDQWLGNILEINTHPESARLVLEKTLRLLVEEKITELANALIPYLVDLLPLLHFAADNLQDSGKPALSECEIDDGLPLQKAACLHQWQTISNLLLTNKHELRKQVDKRDGFPAPGDAENKIDKETRTLMKQNMKEVLSHMNQNKTLAQIFEEFRHLPDTEYSDEQWQVMESLTQLLPALVTRLALVFSRHSQLDHTQVSIAALGALGNEDHPTDLSLRLDYQLKHILVDEFQDTSILQIELLEKLTYGWQPGDGRTLFIVGDGMQSCYRFRNANVGLFLAASKNGIGQIPLQSLQLSANFRSQKSVVSWVNERFAPAFPQHNHIGRGGVRYSPATAIHDEIPNEGVQTILLSAQQELDNASTLLRSHEAELLSENVLQISKKFPGDKIAILVRTRSHLKDIIPALRSQGIRWNAGEIDPLNSYPAVQDLLMLTRSLLNMADVTAWYAILRSPWIGLRLKDIHAMSMASQEKPTCLWEVIQQYESLTTLSPEAELILARIKPVLGKSLSQSRRLPLRSWIELTWIGLGGPATLQTPHYFNSVNHFFNLLQEFDDAGDITDIHRFEDKVTSKYADGLEPEATVTIMTIHKAKGLEFDHVIIPGLERPPRSDDNSLLRWREHIGSNGKPALLISMPSQKGQEHDSTYQHLKYEAALQQRLENTRLLYIGVTRAIKSAILMGSIKSDGEIIKAPDKNSLLAALWPQLEDAPESLANIIQIDISQEHSTTESTKSSLVSRRLPANWAHPCSYAAEIIQVTTDIPIETVHDNLLEREIGEIIHDCLHRAGKNRLDLTNEKAMLKFARTWRLKLTPLTEDLELTVNAIFEQLISCRQHEQFSWMIDQPHQDAASELSISDYRFAGRHEAVIDRTFIDDEGVRWIIDFKSSRPAPEISEEEFLSAQLISHKNQLAKYASLFKELENREIKTALFFTALPRLVEIDTAIETPEIDLITQNLLF